MDTFKDIRPYNDLEVRQVLDNLLDNQECIAAVARLRFPRLVKVCAWLIYPIVRRVLKSQLKHIQTVNDFQAVVEHYMGHMIRNTTEGLSISGLDKLSNDRNYLFVSNHRDIALDPAFVNYALFHEGEGTVRIAIGDNLLTRDYVSDLMRLNKCFIVPRSATGPRQLLKGLKHLSDYIRFSITEDHHDIWIAQREGRAKNGVDESEPAIIKMFAMSGGKNRSLTESLSELHIVPVSISYEYDPCDMAKARELYEVASKGVYKKGEQEDVASIALGIAGNKGHVHVAFGSELSGEFYSADQVAELLDRQIISNYVLHPSNFFAYEKLYGQIPDGLCYSKEHKPWSGTDLESARREFQRRLDACPPEHQSYFLQAYANPIVSKLKLAEAPVAA